MDELKDVSIHHMALKILSDITNLKHYDENIFRTVQVFMRECVNENGDSVRVSLNFHVIEIAIGLFT